jgi:hypothetical protein
VVLAGALLTVSLAERRLRRARVRPVVVTAAVVGVLSIGLLPFVKGSETLSAPTLRGLAERAREVVQMLYHQVGQSALAVYHVDLLALAAAAVLAVGAMRAWPAERARARCLLAALALGLGVSAAANFVTHGFSPAQARYSLWALPGVALFLAAALNRRTGWVAAAAVTLLAAQLFAVYQFTAHGDYFAHGPHRRLTEVIDRGDLATTAVLHDDGDFGFIYYPLRYAYGGRLAQFGPGEPARPLPTAPAEREQALAGFRRLVVVRATKQHAPDLARQITQGDDRPGPVPLAAELTATGRWREAEVHRFVAMVAADVVVLER